eukprot:5572599-Amphidinium_carterae.1
MQHHVLDSCSSSKVTVRRDNMLLSTLLALRSEVSHVKRLVGERLIQQNKLAWQEAASRKITKDIQMHGRTRNNLDLL